MVDLNNNQIHRHRSVRLECAMIIHPSYRHIGLHFLNILQHNKLKYNLHQEFIEQQLAGANIGLICALICLLADEQSLYHRGRIWKIIRNILAISQEQCYGWMTTTTTNRTGTKKIIFIHWSTLQAPTCSIHSLSVAVLATANQSELYIICFSIARAKQLPNKYSNLFRINFCVNAD